MKIEDFKRFDMLKKPYRQAQYLRPVTWLLSYPEVWSHKTHIERIGMEGLKKSPYLLLCNHNCFFDFKVTTAAIFPRRANYVVAMDAFLNMEWLVRRVGGICKRKFTTDTVLVRHLKRVLDNGDVAVIYAEARYSLCGTNAVLPESLGKMIKLFNVPVVTLIMHGHHINAPFWNKKNRKIKGIEATLKQIITKEEAKTLSVKEINERLEKEYFYDDFLWQKEKGIKVDCEGRAEGLHKVLYQCPNCGTEYSMESKKKDLFCKQCAKRWEMLENGQLRAYEGETEFSHIPDWYEWQRSNVRQEVENGTYNYKSDASVMMLPNSKGFIQVGNAVLEHNMDGFTLDGEYEGEKYHYEWPAATLYSCHIEYEYLDKYGDRLDLNTPDNTIYIHPLSDRYALTKFALATEELYQYYKRIREKDSAKDNV